MRVVATSKARPALASQAENAKRSMGAVEKVVVSNCRVHKASAMNRDSIMPSKHKRAESRWVRWKARPVSPSRKADEKLKCTGVIRGVWIWTTIV